MILVCSNVIHGFNGVIESPNFPDKYPSNINCTWIIDAPKGNKVNITFSHFELESTSSDGCKYDYLELREGSNDSPDTELGRYCGTDVLPPKISSTQHRVYIDFKTDDYFTFGGFRLEWVINGCGGYLNRPAGELTSPGYPNPYPADIECEWLIEVDHGYSVEITFSTVNTEKAGGCYYDRVQLFSGADDGTPKLAEFCHSTGPINYTSTTNQMFVKFISDISYAGQGFAATYKAVPLTCGGRFLIDQGFIYSANYPKNYPHGQNCEWFIEVDKNHAINLTFTDFDIEDTTNCTDDYVKVFDGSTRDDRILGTFCRNELPPSIISSGHKILVVMRSDSLIAAKGFKAQFSRTCGARIITNNTGILSTASNLHLRNDENNEGTNCTWIIIAADPADHITLNIFHLDLASTDDWDNLCEHHSLSVYDGDSLDGPLRGSWCTNKSPPTFTSNGNALTIHLLSSYGSTDMFQASYSVLNSGKYKFKKNMSLIFFNCFPNYRYLFIINFYSMWR